MAARGPAAGRGGNNRFAQFKLVLLGMGISKNGFASTARLISYYR